MFSRILSGKKKETTSSSSSHPSPSLSARDSVNMRRSPTAGDKQVDGPRSALFFRSSSATLQASNNSSNNAASRIGNLRSASPPSSSMESSSRGTGVFEADNRLLSVPKQLSGKKSSEPNVLRSARSEKMQKSNSQPVLATRRSADFHRSGSSRNKMRTRDDERGFLDRAFENAASVAIDEMERTDSGESLPSVVEEMS